MAPIQHRWKLLSAMPRIRLALTIEHRCCPALRLMRPAGARQ
jgi:hypothetical protein